VSLEYDAIVIGTGFGGAVTSCRLAERGMRVLVLERGRRWRPEDYPREPGDAWIWDDDHPDRQNGWIDLRYFRDMSVVQGAGIGGGSLIYASVFIEAKPEAFHRRWPQEITYEELKPHDETVGRMLQVQTLPENQLTERYKLMRDGAEATGHGQRFMPVPLAVTFNPEWHYDLEDPFSDERSKTWVNEHGQQQGTCVHCGNCDIGCQVHAKNTLDLNYIPRAEQHGADVRPLHRVRYLTPERHGYRVHFERFEGRRALPGSATAKRVFLAAGSLGSTELLLRCRDQYKTLPQLSKRLGFGWSSNGDFLTPAFYRERRISPTQGPTISSAIDFLDGARGGQRFFVEDGGFPDVLGNYLEQVVGKRRKVSKRLGLFLQSLGLMLRDRDPLSNVMPWFGQAVDAPDGRLHLGRRWYRPWRRVLKLDWDYRRSETVVNALIEMHKELSEATGGKTKVPPTWTVLRNLITPHPLGGCNMGTGPVDGVVDHRGEVFAYPDLFVVDGAIVPRAVGLNPSRTIAALAERTAALVTA